MQKLAFWAVVIAVAAIVLVIVVRHCLLSNQHPLAVRSQGPTVERLERLAHLVSCRVYIADVLVGETESYRGAWLIRGDALIGVNLSRARVVQKDDQTRQATISLPLPEMLQSRVDHEKTRTWEVRRTTWVPWRGDQDVLRDTVMREAQKLVAQAAMSAENIGQAQAAAETILQAIYAEVGWQVQITWDGS